MGEQRIFVGRKAELKQFKAILENSQGQAVVVVGNRGMGKTWLIEKMAEIAQIHADFKCGCIRYEVTPSDSPGSIMELMMEHAFDAAQVEDGSFSGTSRRLEQWRSFLNVFYIGDLLMSLRRELKRNTREQFLERLELVSEKMPQNGRAIFFIDPEKYMKEKSASDWRLVVRDLPQKIKFVFAQRTEDELISDNEFLALANVSCIPDYRLGRLNEKAVGDLIKKRRCESKYEASDLRAALDKYKGHPYEIQAAFDLLAADTTLEQLPQDPTKEEIAKAQWKKLSDIDVKAIRLFKAYAVLDVAVPDDVVESVSDLSPDEILHLRANNYIAGLLRDEAAGKRIYHAILGDYIVDQIGQDEKDQYHSRAVDVYRAKLKNAAANQTTPDALAALRLPEHILAAEGEKAFASSFISECTHVLRDLGLLDACISLSERALKATDEGSAEEAILLGNLGLIYHIRGDLGKAENMHRKSLEINKKLRCLEGIAAQYSNLGLIYRTLGNLDEAENMHNKSLKIYKKLRRLEGMANQYRQLGNVYFTRRDLDEAENMYEQGLDIDENLDRREAMASDYAALGVVFFKRGNLKRAEEWHRKSLGIETQLGRLAGIARQYSGLGNIDFARSDLDAAEEKHKKSLEIYEELKDRERIADEYGNLGNIYLTRSDLNAAEKMLKKSLEIQKNLRRLEGMASDYRILGKVYQQKGDMTTACEHWVMSVGLYAKIGMQHDVRKVQGWIDALC